MKRRLRYGSLLYKPLFVKSQSVKYNPFFVPHTVTVCISKKHILLKHLEKLTGHHYIKLALTKEMEIQLYIVQMLFS